MGKAQGRMVKPTFNRAVKVEASDCRLTSDGGALMRREFDHRLELTAAITAQCHDSRVTGRIRYEIVELLRERVYLETLDYSAQDAADRLTQYPALLAALWDRPGRVVIGERFALQPLQSRFVARLASSARNRRVMHEALAESRRRVVMASSGAEQGYGT